MSSSALARQTENAELPRRSLLTPFLIEAAQTRHAPPLKNDQTLTAHGTRHPRLSGGRGAGPSAPLRLPAAPPVLSVRRCQGRPVRRGPRGA